VPRRRLNQWQVDAVEAADPEAHEEAEDRQKDPAMVRRERKNAGGERKIENCSAAGPQIGGKMAKMPIWHRCMVDAADHPIWQRRRAWA
jgi:hypothetical protein